MSLANFRKHTPALGTWLWKSGSFARAKRRKLCRYATGDLAASRFADERPSGKFWRDMRRSGHSGHRESSLIQFTSR